MSIFELLNLGLGVGTAILGWFARELWSAVKELKNDLAKLKEDLPIYYVRKDDFSEFKKDIMSILQRIEIKLDNKQDK